MPWLVEKSRVMLKRQKVAVRRTITGLVLLFALYALYLAPPADFPTGAILAVPSGTAAGRVAELMAKREMIKSPTLFRLAFRLPGMSVAAGDYLFKEPYNLISLIWRLRFARYDLTLIKITVREGMHNREIATLFERVAPGFDTAAFVTAAQEKEGMLFPETYFFRPSVTPVEIVNDMSAMWQERTASLQPDIVLSGHSLNEIVTMASLLEKEAHTTESRRMISGILWNRLAIGMRLQVDAVFPYLIDKYSLQLTKTDLGYDSPYNTYRYAGLPPGPIANPGLDALRAALNPIPSEYYYYLSDRQGKIYYAKTYAEHLANRRRHIGT